MAAAAAASMPLAAATNPRRWVLCTCAMGLGYPALPRRRSPASRRAAMMLLRSPSPGPYAALAGVPTNHAEQRALRPLDRRAVEHDRHPKAVAHGAGRDADSAHRTVRPANARLHHADVRPGPATGEAG